MAILSDQDIQKELKTLGGWVLQKKEITKTYEFRDFVQAIGFVNSVSTFAEKANHHPDIDIRWNKVVLTLSTHNEGGITQKDIALAKIIDSSIK
jgi:4a-hydroxytetrahydrobiopterin dehydratase